MEQGRAYPERQDTSREEPAPGKTITGRSPERARRYRAEPALKGQDDKSPGHRPGKEARNRTAR